MTLAQYWTNNLQVSTDLEVANDLYYAILDNDTTFHNWPWPFWMNNFKVNFSKTNSDTFKGKSSVWKKESQELRSVWSNAS